MILEGNGLHGKLITNGRKKKFMYLLMLKNNLKRKLSAKIFSSEFKNVKIVWFVCYFEK